VKPLGSLVSNVTHDSYLAAMQLPQSFAWGVLRGLPQDLHGGS
jgi:hypothetical protein